MITSGSKARVGSLQLVYVVMFSGRKLVGDGSVN